MKKLIIMALAFLVFGMVCILSAKQYLIGFSYDVFLILGGIGLAGFCYEAVLIKRAMEVSRNNQEVE